MSVNYDINVMRGRMKSAESVMKVGAVCGGVSLLIGGILLDVVGLVCIIVGCVKLHGLKSDLSDARHEFGDTLARIEKIRNISFIVCILALAMNAYALWVMWPYVMEIINTGDLQSVYNMYGLSGGSTTATGSSSTWG